MDRQPTASRSLRNSSRATVRSSLGSLLIHARNCTSPSSIGARERLMFGRWSRHARSLPGHGHLLQDFVYLLSRLQRAALGNSSAPVATALHAYGEGYNCAHGECIRQDPCLNCAPTIHLSGRGIEVLAEPSDRNKSKCRNRRVRRPMLLQTAIEVVHCDRART